jgi:hypothetical protein
LENSKEKRSYPGWIGPCEAEVFNYKISEFGKGRKRNNDGSTPNLGGSGVPNGVGRPIS